MEKYKNILTTKNIIIALALALIFSGLVVYSRNNNANNEIETDSITTLDNSCYEIFENSLDVTDQLQKQRIISEYFGVEDIDSIWNEDSQLNYENVKVLYPLSHGNIGNLVIDQGENVITVEVFLSSTSNLCGELDDILSEVISSVTR